MGTVLLLKDFLESAKSPSHLGIGSTPSQQSPQEKHGSCSRISYAERWRQEPNGIRGGAGGEVRVSAVVGDAQLGHGMLQGSGLSSPGPSPSSRYLVLC